MFYFLMIPDFVQSPTPTIDVSLWKSIIGILIVLFATFVGVEIRVGNDDDDP